MQSDSLIGVEFNPIVDGERRLDHATQKEVDRAVMAHRLGDELWARNLLEAAGVASHTALRVLSCPAFRRIPRRHS